MPASPSQGEDYDQLDFEKRAFEFKTAFLAQHPDIMRDIDAKVGHGRMPLHLRRHATDDPADVCIVA